MAIDDLGLDVKYTSKCCKAPAEDIYTWPNTAERWEQDFGVKLPIHKDVTICTLCKHECEAEYSLN